MFRVGGTQALLLGPSLLLTISAFVVLTVPQYATWGLLFALGSTAIILDGGAFQLAQIYRAESRLTTRETARLLGLASVSPLILILVTTLGWSAVNSALLAGEGSGGPTFALIVGVGTLLRAWQNVLNGIVIAQGDDAVRFRAALIGAQPIFVGIALLTVTPDLDVLAWSYVIGAIFGIAALAKTPFHLARSSLQRAPSNVPTRTAIAGLSVLLTQGDRIFVGLLGNISSLAAYDFASRIVATGKLLVILMSAGIVTSGAQAAAGQVSAKVAEATRHRTQRAIDWISLGIFISAPILVTSLVLLSKPDLARETAAISIVLSIGQGLHATTAPATAFLSGMRVLKPEVRYQLIALSILLVSAPILGQALGAVGIAAAVALGLAVGSIWFRIHVPKWVAARLGQSPSQ